MPRQVSPQVSDLKEIVSTFNSDPNNTYACCVGAGVGLVYVGLPQYMAVPFTPDKNYVVTAINFAMSHDGGSNGVIVSLNADDNGKPGAEIRTATLTDLPEWDRYSGACCVIASFRAVDAPVTAGTQYWVVAKTDAKTGGTYADTTMIWHHNNIGAVGQYAYLLDTDDWQLYTDLLPAFSVQGTSAP
jgi:hypothetical protein